MICLLECETNPGAALPPDVYLFFLKYMKANIISVHVTEQLSNNIDPCALYTLCFSIVRR